MRLVSRQDSNKLANKSNSTNVSPIKNFFTQSANSAFVKGTVSTEQSKSSNQMVNHHDGLSNPYTKHNNPYQRYMVTSSATKLKQSDNTKKPSKSYIQLKHDLSLQKKSSTPTQYTNEDDLVHKKKAEHRRQMSKVFVNEMNNRPDSGQSKKSTQVNTQVSNQAQSLIQKIREQQEVKPQTQQSQLLLYHQDLIDKQYKKLIDLQQQHYLTFKKKSSVDTHYVKGNFEQVVSTTQNKSSQIHEDLSSQLMNYIKSHSVKNFKGHRSISNPDINTQTLKQLFTFALSQPGVLHTGQEKTNQDSYFIKENLLGRPKCWLLQVSDGHGTNGHFVAKLIQDKLPLCIELLLKQKKILSQNFQSDETNSSIRSALTQAFEKTSRELYSSGIDVTFSGATTVTVLVLENEIWCANIGDSRAIIGRAIDRSAWQIVELSNDHKPDIPVEFKRIIQNGGRVQAYSDQDGNPIGPARVWLREENIPGLAMSRAFGDYVASQVGVISIPEIMKFTLRPQDKFMIIASDGIWEFLTNEWIINTVAEYYQKNDIKGACAKLVQEATLAWQREDEVIDDITCIVVFIGQDNALEINQMVQRF